MHSWLNWREIEKNNDWGVRSKSDATAEMWNQGADGWEERALREHEHNIKQVALMDFAPTDTVLDICCGTGPLTLLIAPKVKEITAMDYGENMLAYVRQHAAEAGYNNIKYLQGNWHKLRPGIDFEPADIAVTRHSPAQANIAAMSLAAKKYCYSVWDCAAYRSGTYDNARRNGFWIASAENKEANNSPRPDGRLYGYNVAFNILYDMGANPSISFARTVLTKKAETEAELRSIVQPYREGMPEELYEKGWQQMQAKISRDAEGNFVYTNIMLTSVMGWDPKDIYFE